MVKKKVAKKKGKKEENVKSESENLGKEVGTIVNYFDHVEVAVVQMIGKMKKGDKVRIYGLNTGTDFEMTIENMQINHKDIDSAKKGDDVGLKVDKKVKRNDKIYLI